MRPMLQAIATASLLTLAPAFSFAQQKWGDIKGQVVWTGKNVPPRIPVNNRGCPCAKPVLSNVL